jgi:hypothetical protein
LEIRHNPLFLNQFSLAVLGIGIATASEGMFSLSDTQ